MYELQFLSTLWIANNTNISQSELQATEKIVWYVAHLPKLSKIIQNVFLVIGRLHEDKLYDTSQAVTSTNVKTVHQTSLLLIESNLDRLGLLSPTHGQRSQQQSGQITFQSVLINKPRFLKAPRHAEIRNFSTKVHYGGDLELVKPERKPASSRLKP